MTPRRLRPLLLLLSALPLAWGWGAARAEAQAPPQWGANVTASVAVAPPPILIETIRNLYFGSVGPGSDVAVPAQPPYAPGTWSAGVRFAGLAKQWNWGVTLVLPTHLVNGGGATIPVSFNGSQYGWICVWNTSNGTPSTCAVMQLTFNPASHAAPGSPVVIDIPNSTPGNNNFAADVYVGGRLTVPGGAVAPGLYSAPLRVTLARIN